MLTSLEQEYIKSLISVYNRKGYKYYVCHTITETNNDYDVCIYFSKEEIESSSDNYFVVKEGIRIYIDSSSRSNYNYNSIDEVSYYNGSVIVDTSEFVYSNCTVKYALTSFPLNPDLMIDTSENIVEVISLFILVIAFGYMFIKDLFFRRD